MTIVDKIRRAIAWFHTRHMSPVRVWLKPADHDAFMQEITWIDLNARALDGRSVHFCGVLVTEDRLGGNQSRMIAADGTALPLDSSNITA